MRWLPQCKLHNLQMSCRTPTHHLRADCRVLQQTGQSHGQFVLMHHNREPHTEVYAPITTAHLQRPLAGC